MEDLYNYMKWGNYDKQMELLAAMSPEQWSFSGRSDNSILKNYMKYTYWKLEEEHKVIRTPRYTLFNTGLFTTLYEPIYVYGENSNYDTNNKIDSLNMPDWRFKGFYTEYDLGNLGIADLPERANYFSDPSLLIFNVNCRINVQYRHILEDPDNKKRLEDILGPDQGNITSLLKGEIDTMKKKVAANYKIAVPQYFNGKIQLLLPLCMKDGVTPDLALVVTKNESGNFYQGHTCLTMEMAYNNARLIAKPESNWLIP